MVRSQAESERVSVAWAIDPQRKWADIRRVKHYYIGIKGHKGQKRPGTSSRAQYIVVPVRSADNIKILKKRVRNAKAKIKRSIFRLQVVTKPSVKKSNHHNRDPTNEKHKGAESKRECGATVTIVTSLYEWRKE